MGRRSKVLGVLVVALMGVAAITVSADAGHRDDPRSRNLIPLGHIEEPASLIDPDVGNPNIHTDLAFWGRHAFQGTWLGFNIRDIRLPFRPRPVSFTECTGAQGDVVVWDDVLVRSWDSGAAPGSGAPPGATCGGEEVPEDFAGLHIFDISDLTAPQLVGSVDLGPSAPEGAGRSCGSHTATGVPDLDNNRLLIYNGPSSAACEHIDVVEVPLDAPEDAAFIRQVDTGRPCHDNGVILGDAMLAACAGGNGFTLMSLDADNLDDPEVLFSKDVNEEDIDGVVEIGHSAAFSFDGEVLVFGHEPGGGSQARCTEDDPISDRSAMFLDTETGDMLGMWAIPRTQTAQENCTFHNFNIVPLKNGQDVFVHGSYQAGTGVVDFSDPANAREIAYTDPDPLPVPEGSPFCAPDGCELGGAWSSYWYNSFIYETNITEGLSVFALFGRETLRAQRLTHLNPQTQEFTIP